MAVRAKQGWRAVGTIARQDLGRAVRSPALYLAILLASACIFYELWTYFLFVPMGGVAPSGIHPSLMFPTEPPAVLGLTGAFYPAWLICIVGLKSFGYVWLTVPFLVARIVARDAQVGYAAMRATRCRDRRALAAGQLLATLGATALFLLGTAAVTYAIFSCVSVGGADAAYYESLRSATSGLGVDQPYENPLLYAWDIAQVLIAACLVAGISYALSRGFKRAAVPVLLGGVLVIIEESHLLDELSTAAQQLAVSVAGLPDTLSWAIDPFLYAAGFPCIGARGVSMEPGQAAVAIAVLLAALALAAYLELKHDGRGDLLG